METKKLLALIPIIGGILALVGTYLNVTKIISGSFSFTSMEIWITCTGQMTGDYWYGQFLGFSRLGGLTGLSSQALIPIIIGFIITGLAVAIIALGAMQFALHEDSKIIIVALIVSIALIVLIILQYIILASIPSALVGDPMIILISIIMADLTGDAGLFAAVIMLGGVVTKAALGFYYIIIGAIIALIVEIVLIIKMRG